MSHHPFEISDIERRASERAARISESRDKKAEERALARPELEHKQVEFLELYSQCSFMPMKDLCSQVGIRKTTLDKWLDEDNEFRKALRTHYNRMIATTGMSRKQVMKGILEAIEMAKDQRQPNSMISGWKEIGRMCGFYEPERREISLSVNGKEILNEIKTVSKERPLELAAEQDAIEVEYEEIRDPDADAQHGEAVHSD